MAEPDFDPMAFVRELYQRYLGRPYDQQGFDNWINAGFENPQDLRSAFLDAARPEMRADTTRMYREYLHREPDAPGLEWNTNLRAQGMPFEDIRSFFDNHGLVGERPVVPGFGAYQQRARDATAGLNNMPGVFSGTERMKAVNPDRYREMFYPAGMNQWRGNMKDPFAHAPAQNPVLAQPQEEQQTDAYGNPIFG